MHPQLNEQLRATDFYKRVLEFALDEKIPDKKAQSYALKMTMDFYKRVEKD